MTTAEMKDHLAGNVTTLCTIVKLTRTDGLVVAYASHSRPITFNSVTYNPSTIELTTPTVSVGLEPNTYQIQGAFDDYITKKDVEDGLWRGAEVLREVVNYFDLTMLSTDIIRGYVGKATPNGGAFVIDVNSISVKLGQAVGDIVQSTDRRRRLDEVLSDISSYTHAGTVKSVTSNRKFKIDYVQPSANYFRYGLIQWASGANDGLEAQIKSSTTTDSGTRTEIELQKSMPNAVAVNDVGGFIMGYDGARASATALGVEAIESFDAEPDMMPTDTLIQYPQ
jgi:uncharacterized phage protein (TIGR02218 family)